MGTSSLMGKQAYSFNMKLLILAFVLAVAGAAPSRVQGESIQPVAIVSSRSEMNADGSYSYAFESNNGIKVEESGSQNRWARKPKTRGPYPKEVTLSPTLKEPYSPSTGWPMKTDSKPVEIICPRLPPCRLTSSSC